MEAKVSTGKYWVLFFLSLAAIIFFLVYEPWRQFFWLILPFVTTFFAKAMDIM
jgi:hypothetical protein